MSHTTTTLVTSLPHNTPNMWHGIHTAVTTEPSTTPTPAHFIHEHVFLPPPRASPHKALEPASCIEVGGRPFSSYVSALERAHTRRRNLCLFLSQPEHKRPLRPGAQLSEGPVPPSLPSIFRERLRPHRPGVVLSVDPAAVACFTVTLTALAQQGRSLLPIMFLTRRERINLTTILISHGCT